MAARKDFSAEQWRALRNAPQLVAFATAAAGNSGLLGSLSEGMAAASAFSEAARANNRLITEILAAAEIRAAREDVLSVLRSATGDAAVDLQLQDAAIAAVQASLDALDATQATGDDADFRKMLAWLAEKVANASKEGDFLGFGGERVSEGERRFLARLYRLIGRPA